MGISKSQLRPEVAAFLAEVEGVCRKHGMSLSASHYDGLEVWDIDPKDDLLHFCGVEDCTKKPSNPSP